MNHGKHKNKKNKVKPGMHMMPDGTMMSDEDMEKYHATRGRVDVYGGKLSKLSVSLGRNK